MNEVTRDETRVQAYYKAYEEHARTLKTWLVAYGVGALVVLMTNEEIWKALAAAPAAPAIAKLSLAGVAAQVAVSAVNKFSMWVCYYGEYKPSFKSKRRYKVGHWLSTQFSFDVLADVATIVCFVIATARIFLIFLANSNVSLNGG